MRDKKTAVITFRTEEWIKEALTQQASQNQWSVAQTVNAICRDFAIDPTPGEITIKISDLVKIVEELKEEGIDKAVHLHIDLEPNENETELLKKIEFEVWECGGTGCISGFDPIYEMTQEEVLDIP